MATMLVNSICMLFYTLCLVWTGLLFISVWALATLFHVMTDETMLFTLPAHQICIELFLCVSVSLHLCLHLLAKSKNYWTHANDDLNNVWVFFGGNLPLFHEHDCWMEQLSMMHQHFRHETFCFSTLSFENGTTEVYWKVFGRTWYSFLNASKHFQLEYKSVYQKKSVGSSLNTSAGTVGHF